MPRPQPCDFCEGAQGKNRSIAVLCFLLLILGARGQSIEASAVFSVMRYVSALRPLAEWGDYTDPRVRHFLATDDWLRRLVPLINQWLPQHCLLLANVVLAPKLQVREDRLREFLIDPNQRVLRTGPEVTSNLMKFCWFRSECNTLCFPLADRFCSLVFPAEGGGRAVKKLESVRPSRGD